MTIAITGMALGLAAAKAHDEHQKLAAPAPLEEADSTWAIIRNEDGTTQVVCLSGCELDFSDVPRLPKCPERRGCA